MPIGRRTAARSPPPAARQFEQQMKVLQGAEQREQGAAKLLSSQ